MVFKSLSKNDIIIGVILFLFSLNFLNFESRIILFFFLLIVLLYKRIYVSKNAIILLIFSILFYLLSIYYHPEYLTYYITPYLLGPFFGYVIGSSIIKNTEKDKIHQKIVYWILIIVFGRFVHGLLNMIISGGFTSFNRNGLDIWTKSILAATGQGALMSLCISLLFYALFLLNKKESKKLKLVLLISIFLSIFNSLATASRTALLIMGIVFLINTFFAILTKQKKKKDRIKIFVRTILLIFLLAVLYNNNIFHVKDSIQSTPLYERLTNESNFESGDEYRKESLFRTINNAYKLPFGDGTLDTTHNLWFDVLKQVGWFPFLLLVIYTFKTILDLIRILKYSSIPIENKHLILSIHSAFLINFFVEPIFKGMPYYFVCFCVFSGMLNMYIKKQKYAIKRS